MKSDKKLYWILALLSTAAYAWITFQLISNEAGKAVTVCLIKNTTGIPCPSCGVTRAVLLLLSGDVQQGILMNPLGCFAAVALLIIPLWIITDTLTQKNTLARAFLWTEKRIKTKKVIYIPLVALALLNWGWNILKAL